MTHLQHEMSRRNSLPAGPAGRGTPPFEKGEAPLSYHGTRGEAIRIYDGSRYITVGTLYPDGEFRKRLKPQHILRTPPAIAIQAAAIAELAQKGCRRIRAEIIGDKTLIVSLAVFQREGFAFDRGYGQQIALALNHWQRENAIQASLFEGVD